MPVLLSGLLIWFLVFYQKKKYTQQLEKKDLLLKQQNLIIENQQAIEKERNRIASEMHDDLGSGLTTIKYLSERALKQAKDPEEEKQVKRISEHSSQLVRNMSEIIWAMNTRYDTLENLLAYIRRYASEY
ncbi:MAG: histidine kinase dimerization/phosphoacceptor domain-containing protein, partial [Saprospiraceae bacterium]